MTDIKLLQKLSNLKIDQILPDLASSLCSQVIIDLPEYFGLPEVNYK
jgi:hypothetical protein